MQQPEQQPVNDGEEDQVPLVPEFNDGEDQVPPVPQFNDGEDQVSPVPQLNFGEYPVPPLPQFNLGEDQVPPLPQFNYGQDQVPPLPQFHYGKDPVSPVQDNDKAYFDFYARISVHEKLLKDTGRTDAYFHAITRHAQEFIKDKVVLDVGCGTGILSIFCALVGAKRVYAVEATDIAQTVIKVVDDNKLSNIIRVLKGRVEDVEVEEKVDIVISEWMGHMLFCENMLASVITARDRWLKPGGLMLPSKATLYIVPFTNTKRYKERINYWNEVYGINMSAFIPLAQQSAFEDPCVETITNENLLANPQVVTCVNCDSVTIHDLRFVTSKFQFNSTVKAQLHGFAFWFDADFRVRETAMPFFPSSSVDSQEFSDHTLLLTTAPNKYWPTHWQQTLLYFLNPIDLEQNQRIEGSVILSQNPENARFLDIKIVFDTGDGARVKSYILRYEHVWKPV